MLNGTEIIKYYNDIQGMVAVLFGMFLQFFLGDRRGFKVVVTIAVSSIFVALFIVPAIIEVIGIGKSSKVAIAMYALSAIMSVEILAILITVLPKAFAAKLVSFLGVRDGK